MIRLDTPTRLLYHSIVDRNKLVLGKGIAMLKVFLVEDEVIMRNGIKNNIHWEKEGMEFVGEAGDGELAYPLIKKTEPDILITDIQMPFMDGLELSRIVKKELPKTKIVIISGYGEFEYAKQAISIGVTDYLLKPISSAKLLEAIKRVGEVIEKERREEEILQRYQTDMEESIQADRQKLLCHMVSGTLSSGEILEQASRLELDVTAPFYQVLLFKLIPCEGKAPEIVEPAIEAVGTYLEENPDIMVFRTGLEGFVLIIKGGGEAQTGDRMEACAAALKRLTENYSQVCYFGGVGNIVQRMGDISKSYHQANRAFASRFFTDLNQILTLEQVGTIQNPEMEHIDVEELRYSKIGRSQVERFLKNGTVEEVEEFVEEYFFNIGEKNHKSLIFRQYVVMDMFMGAADFLKALGLTTDNLTVECRDINDVALRAGAVEEVKGYLRKLFIETLVLRDNLSNKRYGQLLDDAKAYIKENFQNCDISLNMVSAQIGISSSYLSTIFGQESDGTFVGYLTDLRIEKAKEYLMCTGMRSSEIGYEVGYRDSHYFSYIFKKMTGCTPREYRARGKA